jgi:DNA-binding transcriptional regulator YdaS (Cro superfamily)
MEDVMSKIRAKRGQIAHIATKLNITSPAVTKWRRVPAERVIDVERITGISREELRPDLYRPVEIAPSSAEGLAK